MFVTCPVQLVLMHNILHKLIRLLYYTLFLITPLLMSNQTSEMFEFPKMLSIYLVSGTILAFWLIDVAVYKVKIRISRVSIMVWLFVLSQIISAIFSVDIHTSIFGYYGRFNGGVLSIFAYAVLFFVATQIFDTKSFRRLLIVSAVSSILVLLWGVPGRLFGVDSSCILYRGDFSTSCWTNEFRPQERMFSTLGQPNWLGSYFAIHALLGIFLWSTSAKRKALSISTFFSRVTFWLVYMLTMTSGTFWTGSRSSQIGLVLGLVAIALIFLYRSHKVIAFRIGIALLAFTVVTISTWYGSKLYQARSDKITHSGTIRLIVWEGALKLASRYPLTGTGPETFAYTYFLTRPAAHNQTTENDFIYNKVHNELLHYLANTGIIGFVAYVCMLIMFVRSLWHKDKGWILASSIFSLSVINFFGFSTSTSQLLLYLIPVYGLVNDPLPQVTVNRRKRIGINIIGVLFIVTVWIGTLRYLSDYLQADIYYAKAMQYQYQGEAISAVESFTNALDHRFEHIYADKFAIVSAQTAYVLANNDDKGKYKDQVRGFIQIAERMQAMAVRASSSNPMYWKDRARMYTVLSSLTEGADHQAMLKQIQIALSNAKTLAPTDLEVDKLRSTQ